MFFGTVRGTVVATEKVDGLRGVCLRLVQPENHEGDPVGPLEAAVDRIAADVGQRVVLVGSREAALACDPTFVPVDLAIVGLVDDVDRGPDVSR
jgi:ethanolamine utilization protein EutN